MLFGNNQDNNGAQTHVQILTRVRPLIPSDHVLSTPYFQVDPAQGTIVVGGKRLFHFDYVLPFDCPQNMLYKGYIEPLVNACFEGFNISIVAFGQTGSGKTYTIFGPGLLYTMNESDFGMVPRTVRHIFYKTKDYPGRQFSIHASYLEIYNEEIRDLLSVEPFHGEITIQEDANGDTIINGATRMECQTIDDVFSCLETGLALRHTGPMMMNQLSSRSHGIFTLHIQQAWAQDGCLFEVRSKLHFVDLAGSERLNAANGGMSAVNTTGFQESYNPVNSGLLALSSVTAALGDPRRKANHVPYWDSKLTCILKDSLGGNAFTLLIVCLSPSAADLDENVNTLEFASRAANICNRPVSNFRITPISNIPLTNPLPNRGHPQHFIPIGAPSQLYPPPYGSAVTSNGAAYVLDAQSQGSSQNIDSMRESPEAGLDSQTEDELFKLRFAASQWQLLVTNAESLLNELMTTGVLTDETQNRIESWLCMKEEYQDCIEPDLIAIKPRAKSDSTASSLSAHRAAAPNHPKDTKSRNDSKALHVIEELSEPTPTRELSGSSDQETDSESASGSNTSQFTEQLDSLRQRFRETTDRLISSIESSYDTVLAREWNHSNVSLLPMMRPCENPKKCQSDPRINQDTSDGPFDSQVPASEDGRRASIFGLLHSVDSQSLLPGVTETRRDLVSATDSESQSSSEQRSDLDDEDLDSHRHRRERMFQINNYGLDDDHICQEMRRLSETSESRRVQVRETNKQLRKAQQTLKELRKAIKLKEAFINDLAQAGRESEMSQRRFEEKIERLEQDAAQTRSDLAAAQVRLKDLEDKSHRETMRNHKRSASRDSCHDDHTSGKSVSSSDSETHRQRIARHRREIARYELRLRDLVKLLDLTGRSPRKVEELERSLAAMKDQQTLLKQQLRQESERKKKLQAELENDHLRIAELERQLEEKRRDRDRDRRSDNISTADEIAQPSHRESSNAESEREHKWRWLVAEEERLVELRSAIQCQSQELDERESRLEQREKALLEKSQSDACHDASSAGLIINNDSGTSGARQKRDLCSPITQDKQVQTSKNDTSDRLEGPPAGQAVSEAGTTSVDKEAIRREIRNLRHTRDALVIQRQELDERQHRGRELDSVEEHRLLELDEAIEAVDAAIEYKNEVICSRNHELKSPTESGLLTRLMSLSHAETRSLLCKYFQKVVDLRDGSKKMEQQFAELEAQFEDQSAYIRKLSTALRHTQLEVERRSGGQHRSYENKVSSASKHLSSNESGAGGGTERKLRVLQDTHDFMDGDNRDLRKHLRGLLSATPKHGIVAPRTGRDDIATGAASTMTGADAAPSACSSRTPSLLGLHAVQALHEKITGLHRLRGRQTGPATTTTVTREKNKLIIKQQPAQSEQRDSKEIKRRMRWAS